MQEKLYHRDIGFPKKVAKLLAFATSKDHHFVMELKYTRHALEQSRRHEKKIGGQVVLPRSVRYKDCEPIEVRMRGNKIIKVLYRLTYDEHTDLILVIAHDETTNLVVTLWLNSYDDYHDTLDLSRYDVPEEE